MLTAVVAIGFNLIYDLAISSPSGTQNNLSPQQILIANKVFPMYSSVLNILCHVFLVQ